jgi:toxin YoeB
LAVRSSGGAASRRARRQLLVQQECLEDLRYWVETNRKTALRVLALIEATLRDPFEGIGKPEPLRHLGPDLWSRRITSVDRLVYRVTNEAVDFLQLRYHH